MNIPAPEIRGMLRRDIIEVPEVIGQASGIKIFGKTIRSLVFTTDIAIIKNTNADAIIAVHPFTPQPSITHAIMMAADVSVFCGVGGGLTQHRRVINLALDAEFQGAIGVVVNALISNETLKCLAQTIDIPVAVTVVSEESGGRNAVVERIEAGATILNVPGAAKTAKIVRQIRDEFPDIPIIATGGPTDETILKTIIHS
ncbi:MAG: hypothetical protein BME93_05155 [Methanosarcinales archaeon Met12]|nr:MAG: hypothetical protein BME93_05155 [Methanosarcinales archaeon Met12]